MVVLFVATGTNINGGQQLVPFLFIKSEKLINYIFNSNKFMTLIHHF